MSLFCWAEQGEAFPPEAGDFLVTLRHRFQQWVNHITVDRRMALLHLSYPLEKCQAEDEIALLSWIRWSTCCHYPVSSGYVAKARLRLPPPPQAGHERIV